MSTRRKFLSTGLGATLGVVGGYLLGRNTASAALAPAPTPDAAPSPGISPMGDTFKGGQIISTWYHGLVANDAAWKVIGQGGQAVDAVEAAARIVELDPKGSSVGLGGRPDREGHVTLDACIMDHTGNAGSVTAIENIMHPITVARKVMDETPHVMLTAEGAYQFAREHGMEHTDLLTEDSRKAWQNWLKESQYKPIINIENHDTIGIVAQDQQGNLSGACTTSGLAFKMRGRVGDSPIIGAGLFVDNEIGAATATGLGEAVMKSCGSFLIVELMRQGMHPQAACEEAVRRIVAKQKGYKDFQIGYLAIRKDGEVGAHAIHYGFNYAHLRAGGENHMVDVSHVTPKP